MLLGRDGAGMAAADTCVHLKSNTNISPTSHLTTVAPIRTYKPTATAPLHACTLVGDALVAINSSGLVTLWDKHAGHVIRTCPVGMERVADMTSDDKYRLFVAGCTGVVVLDTEHGTSTSVFSGSCCRVRWAGEDELLVGVSQQGVAMLRLCAKEDYQLAWAVKGHADWVASIVVLPGASERASTMIA